VTARPALHHVGLVVASLDEGVRRYLHALPLLWDERVYHDPVQTVRVTFLRHAEPGAPLIELVEPLDGQSRVAAFLARGGGFHHLCYEVDSVQAQLEKAAETGAVVVFDSRPAVAFDGREIAWVCTRDRLLIEYLARAPYPPRP
jgi:methylmalonyl-CoA/ethylmalonyl-CoA epimerase